MTFGEVVIGLRTKSELSQRSLAKRAGVTNSTISRIENNQVCPDLDTINKLSGVLGVSRLELVATYYGCQDLREAPTD